MKKYSCYTRYGDTGTTSLANGVRVSKSDARIALGGEIDELISLLGTVGSLLQTTGKFAADGWDELLHSIQRELFSMGGVVVEAPTRSSAIEDIQKTNCKIFAEINRLENELPELRSFILPGGSLSVAMTHFCRSVCRRVERSWVAYSESFSSPYNKEAMILLNSLSDLLFVIARYFNEK